MTSSIWRFFFNLQIVFVYNSEYFGGSPKISCNSSKSRVKFSTSSKKYLKNDFKMKKPYISVNFWLCSSLTMSVRYQLMANNANRFNRGGIIIDNEETEGNGFGCQNSKNCCIFIFLVTVGFIMYLPFIPFSSNKRKFFNFDFGLICQLTSDFSFMNTCREWFKDDLELSLIYSSILISAKNFFTKQKMSKSRIFHFSVKSQYLLWIY